MLNGKEKVLATAARCGTKDRKNESQQRRSEKGWANAEHETGSCDCDEGCI
jgi:hypothetical protein